MALPQAVDDWGWTPLHYAITSASPEAVDLLITCGVDLTKQVPVEMISEHQEQMDADYLLRLTNAGPYTGRRITLRLEDDEKTLLQGSRQEILMESLI